MRQLICAILQRELRLAWRRWGDAQIVSMARPIRIRGAAHQPCIDRISMVVRDEAQKGVATSGPR